MKNKTPPSLKLRVLSLYTMANDACKSGDKEKFYKAMDILTGIAIAMEYPNELVDRDDIKANMNIITMKWSYFNE